MSRQLRGAAFVCVIALGLFSQPDSHDAVLIPGTTVRISPAIARSYRLYLSSDALAHLTVVQHDVDVVVAYRGKADAEWKQIDAYEYGLESICIAVKTSQMVAVEVRVKAVNADDAFYTVTTQRLLAGSASEGLRVEGERLATEVKQSLDRLPDDAADVLNKSRRVTEIWRRLNAPALEAASMVETANILFAKGRLVEALELYLECSALSARNNDAANLAESLNDAGYIELRLGKLRVSEEHLAQAFRIWADAGSRYGRLTALNNTGLLAWQSGEFALARRQYQQALELVSKQDRRSRGLLLNNLGLIYRSMGDYQQAIANLLLSLDLLPKTDTTARAKTMINLGRACLAAGDLASSIGWLARALPLARQSPDPHTVADVFNTMGQAHAENGELAAGESELTEALGIFDAAGDRRGRASALHRLGLVKAAQHNFSASLRLLHEALDFRLSVGFRDDAADTLFALARVSRSAGEPMSARRYAAAVLRIVESLRSGIPGEYFRISYFSTKQSFYEFYINLLMELHRANPSAGFNREAFDVAEHARGRAMLDILSEAKAQIRRGVDPELLSREELARKTLAFASGEMSRLEERPHTREREKELQKQREKAAEDYRNVETEICDRSQTYASLIWPQARNLAEIQRQAVDPDTVLLEYSLGQDISYLWLVSRNSFMSFELPGQERLLPLFTEMHASAADYRARLRDPSRQRSYRLCADSLSSILLGPVSGKLVGKKLIIVTPGLLQQVPFAALWITGARDGESKPLGVTNEIVRMTSASAFLEIHETSRAATRPPPGVAVFADPVFDTSDPRVPRQKRQKAASAGTSFARLPFTKLEAEEILRLFPRKTSLGELGFDASRENLLRPDIGSFRYVHFGTHAIIEQIPEFSAIALSGVSPQGQRVDGLIRLPDVYNLPHLSADLVVLAGCDTGAGQVISGEGLIGLTRGFLYAGARSVLINLWSFEDGPWTLEIIKSLYSRLAGGEKGPAAALRAVREALWQRGGRWRDDYLLAGLELYGDNE